MKILRGNTVRNTRYQILGGVEVQRRSVDIVIGGTGVRGDRQGRLRASGVNQRLASGGTSIRLANSGTSHRNALDPKLGIPSWLQTNACLDRQPKLGPSGRA